MHLPTDNEIIEIIEKAREDAVAVEAWLGVDATDDLRAPEFDRFEVHDDPGKTESQFLVFQLHSRSFALNATFMSD